MREQKMRKCLIAPKDLEKKFLNLLFLEKNIELKWIDYIIKN